MPEKTHMDYLHVVANEDIRLLEEKERTYQGSWKKRGGTGAFHMLARKWDRIENMVTDPIQYDSPTISGTAWRVDLYDVFGYISADPSGADGTVLAEVRDLRRYLMLVEAEMMARGVVAQPGPTIILKENHGVADMVRGLNTGAAGAEMPVHVFGDPKPVSVWDSNHKLMTVEALRARQDYLNKENAKSPVWSAAVGARSEEIKDIERELRRRETVPLEDSNKHAERMKRPDRIELNNYEWKQLPADEATKYEWNHERQCYMWKGVW